MIGNGLNNLEYERDETDSNKIWLQKIFKKYYFKYFANISIPQDIKLHEFGFSRFDGKMYRHISFDNPGELYASILKFSPSDIYCSSSFYRFPSESIDKKDRLGSELIFDIDGKDLHTECSLLHDLFICKSCLFSQHEKFTKCPKCNNNKIRFVDIPCKKCVISLKKEVLKLKEFLIDDFGVNDNNIVIYFSGNNGFHIHVSNSEYYPLNSIERSEISSYLLGKGIKIEVLGFKFVNASKNIVVYDKKLLDTGWKKRISKKLKLDLTTNLSRNTGSLVSQIEKLVACNNCDFQQIFNNTVYELSVKIDPMVTIDIHRIFRLGGSINSKSGLVKQKCDNLSAFDPFRDACYFDKTMSKVDSHFEIPLTFNGKKFHIVKGINEVPEFVSVYLISKGLANIILNGVLP